MAYVDDELLVQYRSSTDKKSATPGTVQTTTFRNQETYFQSKTSKLDSKKCPLNGGHYDTHPGKLDFSHAA